MLISDFFTQALPFLNTHLCFFPNWILPHSDGLPLTFCCLCSFPSWNSSPFIHNLSLSFLFPLHSDLVHIQLWDAGQVLASDCWPVHCESEHLPKEMRAILLAGCPVHCKACSDAHWLLVINNPLPGELLRGSDLLQQTWGDYRVGQHKFKSCPQISSKRHRAFPRGTHLLFY